MFIIQTAAELAPIAKVGGLGDVVYGLSKELVRLGHRVEIILPKYDCLNYSYLKNLKKEIDYLKISSGAIAIWSAEMEHLEIKLIEPLQGNDFFCRGKIYGFLDDIPRFLCLSESALTYINTSKKKPDVIHVHDWHTALIPCLQKEKGLLKNSKSVLTLHSIAYQGKCDPDLLTSLGLKKAKIADPHSPHLANLLKAGMVYADAITTVSPTYEKEIKSQEGGCGLDKIVIEHSLKLKGILNGIDPEFWNPEKDPLLFQPYPSKPPIDAILKGKESNREHLRARAGLLQSDQPLVACVTRLVPQKGPDLIKYALYRTLQKGGQFILLSDAGSPEILRDFQEIKMKLSSNKNLSICFDHDEPLAHLIFAGADMLIVPSLFEPCGLTQLLAMRYGTVPVVRKTGGLADTVFDIDTSDQLIDKRNGFTFDFPDSAGINWALDRALHCYAQDKKKWHSLINHGMLSDFSWHQSVQEYLKIYQQKNLFTEITHYLRRFF